MEKIEKWLKEAENICLITHTDTDGICSAALFLKYLKKLGKKAKVIFGSANTISKREFYKKIPSCDLIIVTDIPLDQSWDIASQEIGNKRIIIIDHHIPFKNLNSSRIIHINPMFEREVYIPASKLVYDIFDIKEYDWLALVGVLGDSGERDSKEFVKSVLKKYGEKKQRGKFGLLDEMIGSAMICKNEKGARECLKIVENADNYTELLKNRKLKEYREKVNNYLKEMQKEFEKKAEVYREINTIFFEIKPKYNIGSALSSILSKKIEHKTIIIINRKNGVANLNFRRQDGKIDMKELAEFSTRGIGKGGGHKKAAGGTIPSEKVDEFKLRAISWLMLKERRL